MATYVYTPAPMLDEAKKERVAAVKREAHGLLAQTDWYIVRNQETGMPVPQAVLDYRAAIRAAADRAEQEIAALANVKEVQVYTVQWPENGSG